MANNLAIELESRRSDQMKTMGFSDSSSEFSAFRQQMESAHRHIATQATFTVPEFIGKGFCKKFYIPSLNIETIIVDMMFSQEVRMSGVSSPRECLTNFVFLTKGRMDWATASGGKEFSVKSHEGIHLEDGISGKCIFERNTSLSGLSITIPQTFNNRPLFDAEMEKIVASIRDRPLCLSPKSETIIQEISNFPHMINGVQQLYLEAKLLELLAVHLTEGVKQRSLPEEPPISKEEKEKILLAKRILDQNITKTPSLYELSRLVCLNDYKLKKGFKTIFGQPIYAYVLGSRLEKARHLLECSNSPVSHVAELAGYSDLGHFGKEFKKRFGYSPTEYRKKMH